MKQLVFFVIGLAIALHVSFGEDDDDNVVTPRIFYGEYASQGQFPFMGFLTYGHIENETFFIKCGGTIIHRRWALTAHHCRDRNYSNPVFTVGTIYQKGNVLLKQGIARDVVRFYLHELEWTANITNPRSWMRTYMSAYDIALMSFNESLTYTKTIRPIKLDWGHGIFYYGKNATYMGWGNTELPIWTLLSPWSRRKKNETGFRATILRYLTGKVIRQRECHIQSNYSVSVQDGVHVCVEQKEPRTTCQGDSGGPAIMTSDKGELYQIGVLSFGTCGEMPAVFGNVVLIFEWIRKKLAHCGDNIFEDYGNDHPYSMLPIDPDIDECLIQTEREWEWQEYTKKMHIIRKLEELENERDIERIRTQQHVEDLIKNRTLEEKARQEREKNRYGKYKWKKW